MNFLYKVSVATLVAFLVGCSTASGPIKGYDSKTPVEPARLVRVYLPPAINVLEVNGIEKESPFIEEGLNELQLLPGTNEITIEYERHWGSEVSGGMVTSQPITLRIDAVAGAEYILKHPVVTDIWEAMAMVNKFKPWLENRTGGRVTSREVKANVISAKNPNLSAEEIVARQNPLQKLKFWWKLADKKDRKAFQNWVKQK